MHVSLSNGRLLVFSADNSIKLSAGSSTNGFIHFPQMAETAVIPTRISGAVSIYTMWEPACLP